VDALLSLDGKKRHLFGRRALDTEAALARTALAPGEVLPVFLGAGLGRALDTVLAATDGALAVVDKERAVYEATGVRSRLMREHGERVLWIDDADPDAVVAGLTRWQLLHGGKTLLALPHPAYLRLDGAYYRAIRDQLETARAVNVRQRAAYPRFAGKKPRVLCILRENYFIQPEALAALTRLGAPLSSVTIAPGAPAREFIAELLREILAFKPDFVLTLNHHGVDEGGMLTGLLASLDIPLASWLVDNPELLLAGLGHLAGPGTMLFSCDAASVAGLAQNGQRVRYLPLASDPELFKPLPGLPQHHPWRARVSFVGESFRGDVAARLKSGRFPAALLRALSPLTALAESDPHAPVTRLLADFPEAAAAYRDLSPPTRRRDFDLAVAFSANRAYRERCLAAIMEFDPLLAGPPSLKAATRRHPGARRIGYVYYNTDLPLFYQLSEINFNTTGIHMRGALNQRLFDVPACGAFLLTDHTPQIEALFDPEAEIACYRDPDEIPERVRFYLAHPEARTRIAKAARRRVLAEHTYDHRLAEMLAAMRQAYD